MAHYSIIWVKIADKKTAFNSSMEIQYLNVKQLKLELRYLVDTCFWTSSSYWSTRPPNFKSDKTKTRIKVAYLARMDWFAFVFSKFHQGAIEIFRSRQKGEVWFYQEPINRFTSFSAWCITNEHFETIFSQLQSLDDVELAIVVPATKEGPKIPVTFEGQEFFEINKDARAKSKS